MAFIHMAFVRLYLIIFSSKCLQLSKPILKYLKYKKYMIWFSFVILVLYDKVHFIIQYLYYFTKVLELSNMSIV